MNEAQYSDFFLNTSSLFWHSKKTGIRKGDHYDIHEPVLNAANSSHRPNQMTRKASKDSTLPSPGPLKTVIGGNRVHYILPIFYPLDPPLCFQKNPYCTDLIKDAKMSAWFLCGIGVSFQAKYEPFLDLTAQIYG